MSKFTKMSPFQIVCGFNPPTPVNHFNSLTKTRVPMSNIKYFIRDNILDPQIDAQKYYNPVLGEAIFVVGEKMILQKYNNSNQETNQRKENQETNQRKENQETNQRKENQETKILQVMKPTTSCYIS
ncbi:hypothetical protein ACTFIW_000954 [Dictyostelium discoideum]